MKRTLIGLVLSLNCILSANAAYYACGGFNGWNPVNSAEFTLGDDGLYRLEIDFSGQNNYKVSTEKPTGGSTEEVWAVFDSGAVKTVETPMLYMAADLKPGVENMTAPVSRRLTVVINPELNRLAYTDGNREIDWGGAPLDPQRAWSATLPVLFIETAGRAPIESKENYLDGTYYLDPMGVEGVEAIGSAEAPLVLKIKGRGNYTWRAFNKKPYRLKLDKKAGLLGMKKSKHFALLAHADDNHGFMRNAVGFEVSRRVGLDWTPTDRPVEVVLNGEYIGLYFLTETIRIDEDRVNVFEQPDGQASTNVTGGWLVELDNYDDDPHVEFYSLVDGARLIFTHKTPEVLSNEQSDWLLNQMKDIDRLIAWGDKSNAAWLDYVDGDALANFYIVQEIMDNYESFTGSCYLHRDIDDATLSADGADSHKWKFGPVWDFGSTFFDEKSQFCYEGRPHHMAWIGEMCKFPEFMDLVKARWNEIYPAKYGDMDSFIDAFVDNISEAARYDKRRWPEYGNEDMEFHRSDIKRRMQNSVNWIHNLWGGSSAIESLSQPESLDIFVANGQLVVKSAVDQTVIASRIDGTTFPLRLSAGRNHFTLPAGLYIIATKKFRL